VSLRTRVVLAAAYLLAVVVIALEVPLARTISQRAATEFQLKSLGSAALLASRISDDVARAQQDLVTGETAAVVAIDARIADLAGRTQGSRIVVVDADGLLISDSSGSAERGGPFATSERPEFAVALGGQINIRGRFSDTVGDNLLMVAIPVVDNGAVVGAVRFSLPQDEIAAGVQRRWLGLAFIGLGVIAVGLVLAWVLATSLARPVRRLEEAARRLGKGDLETRAPEEGPKEVATLAQSFNRMAGALAANITAQRDFLANASHQLRTPLTGIKLRLEAIEGEGGSAGAQAQKAQVEVNRLGELVEDLLELARASSVESTGGRVDLVEVARAAVERWRGPAAQAGKRILERVDGPCTIWGNAEDLGHVLDNLIENSIRYCPDGTDITVETRADSGRPTLVVSDTGPGIPLEDRHRIFERFYRGSTGRRAGPGTGLGLAVAAELVRRWDGKIRLANGQGTSVEATFPRAPTLP
jgi:signal transduction histidine kinase